MLFYNHYPDFGEGGPFEAESREALADRMMTRFEKLAKESFDAVYTLEDKEEHGLVFDEWKVGYVKTVRGEFLARLEEVTATNMVDQAFSALNTACRILDRKFGTRKWRQDYTLDETLQKLAALHNCQVEASIQEAIDEQRANAYF